ncbi:2,3-dihydro-2,3-dihydroxybenzoate dehydrogenase [Amycolatopsis sp. EV170708-02-1]|uniref:2,3-dihydro-2,3-dihydroxybenzoate dehydrogenase n=1 Tax=Amycolatopsis sp. EV170708-02-1 TaxID=2919322 RepID=UPI001F0C123F|nr:2,3-dihydro-2,3-dihydroxybenzoate dehydrogenase [Amycolatopsis sp. EV170708-02-1]UMP01315.1 2,3-dihydro-2,3-dihydroxybenzoate dehydrogenase [Amycolatopsis sp. EV170708-02-1]
MNGIENRKVALITGAAGGIGAQIARGIAARDIPVALLDRQVTPLRELADELGATGLPALPIPVDVTSAGEVEAAVEKVEADLGPIEYLVNAAGVLRVGTVDELSDNDWTTTLGVNAGGVFHVSRAVTRRMIPRRRGAVVTVASNAASTARFGMSAYAASKAAATAFTACLGLELAGYGIRCNTVAPGSTGTRMLTELYEGVPEAETVAERTSVVGAPESFRVGIPLGKIASPGDVSEAVLFLLSDGAGHITMQTLTVDGGATLGV